jgi:hypothetical protein
MSAWLRTHRLAALGAGVACVVVASVSWHLLRPHPDPWLEAIRKRGYPTVLAELDSWYPSVPPAENAAFVYTNAFALLTNASGTSPITGAALSTFGAQKQLPISKSPRSKRPAACTTRPPTSWITYQCWRCSTPTRSGVGGGTVGRT